MHVLPAPYEVQPLRPLCKSHTVIGRDPWQKRRLTLISQRKPFTSQPHLEQHGQTAVALRLPPGVEASQAQSTKPSPPDGYGILVRSTTLSVQPQTPCPATREAPWKIITNDKRNNPNKARTAWRNFHTDSYLDPPWAQGRSEAQTRLLDQVLRICWQSPPLHLEKKLFSFPGDRQN